MDIVLCWRSEFTVESFDYVTNVFSPTTLAMVAQSNVVPAVNGGLEHISKNKINAKSIKSKTQLRRLKQKLKKQEAVRLLVIFISCFTFEF